MTNPNAVGLVFNPLKWGPKKPQTKKAPAVFPSYYARACQALAGAPSASSLERALESAPASALESAPASALESAPASATPTVVDATRFEWVASQVDVLADSGVSALVTQKTARFTWRVDELLPCAADEPETLGGPAMLRNDRYLAVRRVLLDKYSHSAVEGLDREVMQESRTELANTVESLRQSAQAAARAVILDAAANDIARPVDWICADVFEQQDYSASVDIECDLTCVVVCSSSLQFAAVCLGKNLGATISVLEPARTAITAAARAARLEVLDRGVMWLCVVERAPSGAWRRASLAATAALIEQCSLANQGRPVHVARRAGVAWLRRDRACACDWPCTCAVDTDADYADVCDLADFWVPAPEQAEQLHHTDIAPPVCITWPAETHDSSWPARHSEEKCEPVFYYQFQEDSNGYYLTRL